MRLKTGRLPVTLDTLKTILQEQFDYEIEDTILAASEELVGYRSVFIQKKRPSLLINSRRWLTARIIRDMDEQGELDAFRERPLVGIQMSEFLNSRERFLCIGFGRPLVLTPNIASSVIVGFREEPNMDNIIRFVHDPAVPAVVINETCERCPLTPEECQVRAAEPTVLWAEQRKKNRQDALQKLMAQFHG